MGHSQKSKALETTKTERSFKGFRLMEDQENEFKQIIKTQQEDHDTDDDMNKFMKKIAAAAEQTIPDNKIHNRKQD